MVIIMLRRPNLGKKEEYKIIYYGPIKDIEYNTGSMNVDLSTSKLIRIVCIDHTVYDTDISRYYWKSYETSILISREEWTSNLTVNKHSDYHFIDQTFSSGTLVKFRIKNNKLYWVLQGDVNISRWSICVTQLA